MKVQDNIIPLPPASSSAPTTSSLPPNINIQPLDVVSDNYSCSSCGNWGSLGEDLLGLILDKLLSNSVYDYIRCATVCKSWFYSTLHSYRRMKKKKNHQQQLPLLLIPGTEKLTNRSKRSCCGSSYGWLIFADEQDTLSLTLFNPFTSSTIHLPALITQNQLQHIKDIYSYYFYHEYDIIKAVLSDDPTSSDNYQLLTLQFGGRLALFTSTTDHGTGSSRWIYSDHYFDLGCSMETMHDDIIYFNGKFHALINAKLGSIEIFDDEKPNIRLEPLKGVEDEIISIMSIMRMWPIEDPGVSVCTYLAESISGTLLYVEKFSIRRIPWYYRVYELEEEATNDGITKFKLLGSNKGGGGEMGLGDQALFLGYNQPVCVRASDFPGCISNSIYFADELCNKFDDINFSVYILGEREEDTNSSVYKLEHSHTHLPPPIWIVPQPNLTLR